MHHGLELDINHTSSLLEEKYATKSMNGDDENVDSVLGIQKDVVPDK
jgi:hypothetical protein